MPRVVSGEFRGAQLFAPKGDNTRPTTDKVKEALFSMIQGRIPGCDFLDIFSGTGQVGIEAVSRGANSATLVEKSGEAFGIIKKNLEKIHAQNDDRFQLLKMPYSKALARLADEGRQFDVIFLDPPYKMAFDAAKDISAFVSEHNLLKEGGVMIVEHSNEYEFDNSVIKLQFNRSCSYGITVITFFT